jgi:hypothetical protein
MGQAESRDDTRGPPVAAPAQGGAMESLGEALGINGCTTPCKGERIFARSMGHVPARGRLQGRNLGAGAMCTLTPCACGIPACLPSVQARAIQAAAKRHPGGDPPRTWGGDASL